ncbi:hypothetical protein V8C42DRAFT_123036 [Trichoderma barbatum]
MSTKKEKDSPAALSHQPPLSHPKQNGWRGLWSLNPGREKRREQKHLILSDPKHTREESQSAAFSKWRASFLLPMEPTASSFLLGTSIKASSPFILATSGHLAARVQIQALVCRYSHRYKFNKSAKPFSAADGFCPPAKPFSSQQQLQANRCKSLGNQHRPDHSVAQAAAREASQDETRLERRFGGDEALLETRAALIGRVRVCTPLDAVPCPASHIPAESWLNPTPHAIMHEQGCVGCSTAWNATSLSLIPRGLVDDECR